MFAVEAVTLSAMVHDAFAATAAPDSVTVVAPAGAERAPPQVVDAPAGDPTVTPLGNASLNVIPLNGAASVALSAIVRTSCETPFGKIDVGENVCDSVALGAAVNVTEALAEVSFDTPPC